MTIENEYFISVFGSGLLPLICNERAWGRMSRFHIYKLFSIHFNLKKTCQDILYTMDNLEIRGTLGRNSYSRCEAVVVILIVIAELFLLRCILDSRYICTNKATSFWGLFCSLPHKKELCYILIYYGEYELSMCDP